MKRITDRDLNDLCRRINEARGTPVSYHNADRRTNVGHVCLTGAYGGYRLVEIVSEGGAERPFLEFGLMTKRQLFMLGHSWLDGFERAKKQEVAA